MVSKNNKKLIAEKNRRNEKQRFAIRKLNVGVASVLLGITFSIYGGGQVVAHADTNDASDQVATSDAGDNSLANKSEVTLSSATSGANQSSTSATSANSAVQSQASANSQTTVTTNTPASDNAVASSAAVETTKDQSTAENQPSASQEVQTPAQAQPVAQENGSSDASLNVTRQVLNTIANRNSVPGVNYLASFAAVPASDSVETTTLNLFTNQETNANNLAESKVATTVLAAEAEDPNTVTVSDAKGFINAIQNGTATTINVAKDLNLAEQTDNKYTEIQIKNKRDIVIQSDNPEEKRTIDFSGYSFDMNTQNSVTFKDLNIYARSYWGLVYNAGGYTFDNVNFTGSQLIYTKPSINSTLTFKNTITANSVSSYVGPLDGKTRDTQQNGGQQILQFEGGTNQIIFDENSNVTLTTEDANALEIDGGTTTIDVKDGANVAINPHSKGNPENRNGIGTGKVARAIAANAKMTINIDPNATLTINTEKVDGDKDVAGALYLNSDAALNVNGKLVINSNGTPNASKNNGVPVYINGNANINVGNGGSFVLDATNLGDYSSSLVSVNGKGTVKLDPHSTFKISADGTGALTAINLSSGSTFTSDQPKEFTIDLSANTSSGKTLIKNGTINFTRVKNTNVASQSQVPLGKVDATYSSTGALNNSVVTSLNKDVPTTIYDYIKSNASALSFVAAGEDVTLNSLHLDKNNQLTGIATSTGDSKTPIYITVLLNNSATGIKEAGMYRLYTDTDGNITTTKVTYTGTPKNPDGSPKPNGGEFSIDLSSLASQLTDDAKITVVASKDFVESPTLTETVAVLRQVNTTTLQELVNAAPAEEAKPSYYNATEEAQTAYKDAIAAGQEILDNPTSYDQRDVDGAVSVIQLALTALTGKETDKTALQAAIDDASVVESSNNYTNADSNLQKAYTDAISAGQKVLSNTNATQREVSDALTAINTAKTNLNGDFKKAESRKALQQAVDESKSKMDVAVYYNSTEKTKKAYDDAISAGQKVLDNPDATATQITDALTAINTAKYSLDGQPTNKSALQTAVDNSATVKGSNNYTNADETQKTAYDNAVTAAQTVLDKANATQAEVNQALQDLETANSNLNGDAKTEAANKAALEAAVKDASNVRNTPAFYNGSEEAQTAYNNAINAGQAVLNEANPSASEVKNALDAINAAKDNLKGVATNTQALESALTKANDAKETGNYTNADQANQEALNNAITAGQEILKNTNATQAEVDNAAKAITDAINSLNGDTNLANAKNAATEDIQKALDTKTTEITDATNIDQATKDQLIADAKKTAEDANTAINQATDANAVNTAKAEGITNINKVTVPSLDGAKEAANQAIDQALDTKTKEINNAENIDQTTKDQLIKEATDAANTAKDAIEKATTNDAATKAGQAGVDAINNVKVPSVTDSQNAAKEAIDDALNAKTKEINDANNIDQTTKDQLIKEATDAANNAKEAIDQATTADAIKTAQDEGTTNINNVTVPSLEDAKKTANKAVDDALTAQTEVINKADNLSDAEKKDLIDQATAEATTAKDAIEKATTNDEATKAGQAGVDAIKKIVPTSLDTVKSDANKAIEKALTKKLEEINSANNLTTDEKTALTQEANTAADKAKEKITKATTNDAVIEAQTNGVTAIDDIKVPTESAVKEAAKQAVADAATAKNNAIDASNLTDEEKAALKQKVTEAQKAADQAIDNATTDAAVTEAQTNGVTTIDDIKVPTESAVKEAAKQAVSDAAEAKNNAIDASNLTAEEKAALKQKVTEAQNAADQAIDNATTNAAVTEAQTNGVTAIDDIKVPTESAVKEAAKQAVADAATAKNNAIDASNLTDEEKTALKQKVTDAQNAADQAIDSATTNAAVTEAQTNGVNAIKGIDVPNTSATKEQAITDLNTAAENAKKAIDQDSNLTDEEKQAAKDQIDSDAKTAQDAINNAKTDNGVNDAVNNGKVAIDKDVANAAIDNAAAGKLKEIQDPLTTEEKQAYTDLINSEANNAKQNIANATTVEEVTTAQTNGVNEITNTEIPTTSSAKEKAIAAINDALQTKTDEINNASNINTQEKTDLINQATEAANAAKNNINNATTNADVDTAQTKGEKAIADVTVPNLSDVKKESIDLINKALDAKTNEINNASNLSQDEKQGLINDATNAATEAINNINQSQTNDDAKAAATTGVQNIENVTIPTLDDAKKNANQAIEDALNTKVNEINNASNLNDTEKQKLVDQATEAATTAKNNVEKATTNDDARDAANAGIDNIKGITFTSLEDAKNAANTAIDNALQVKTDEINNASNLSTDEKQDLINQATEAANAAKNNINNATTNDAVTEAQNKGIADIANVTVPSLDQVKQDAINAIKQVQDAKNKQISAASNLSAEEQKELSDQVDKIANDAIDKIKESSTTTNDAVTATRDDAIKQITDLFIPTLEGAQTDALNAIESAKNAKLTDINNATHLTDQEKQALVDQTNKAADDATKAINAAQTNDEVKSAETAGLDNINNITIPTLVQKQQEAIEELNAARDAKNSAIDNAADLTTDEKNSLKDKVQAEYSNAVSNITSATTDEAVTTAKENGIAAIKDIQIPTKSAAKEQATTDLNTAVDDAKKAIDQDSNLTDEEKQAAKDQIDSDAKKAQEAIDNAKTDDEVNSAVDNGKLAIDKDIANAAIDNAAAGKKAEIAKSPLTDEEKTALNNKVAQKAQDAKEAINDATTPEAVTTAQENGIKKINDTEVPTESAAKEAAKKAVAEAAETKNNAIDSSNLTNEEKTALKQEVTDAQNAANTAIDNATTNAAVTEAEDNGIKAINGIEVPTKSAAKEQATTDLNDAVDDAKKAIDQDSNLTDEEKQAAKDQIDSDAKKAQEVIDNAKTADEVKTAVDNGQLAIDKDVANAAIDNAVAGKKAEIAKAPLTTDEAKALNDLVDQEAKAAKKAIDSATTIPAVEDAKNTGVAAINDIAVPTTSSTKDQANQTIDDALANKTKEINDATNLSNKQKQDLIDEATEEAAKAKENIKNATSNEAVNKATTDGVDAIANVTVPSLDDAKKDASQLIDDVLKQKEAEINNASHLTDQEKQDLIHQAQNAADEAKDKINQATTNDDVATERDAGAEKIANIAVPSLDDAKDKATKAIDDALADKTKEINEQTHLSDQEKNDLIKQITDIADKAKDKINNDSNDAEVVKDEKEGIDAIVDTKVPGLEDHKQNAIKSLDEAKSTKLVQIDEAGHLTADEKANLTQQVDAEYNKALDNINKATTNDDADKASADGVEAILNIAVPSLNEKKQDSIDALNEVRDAKKEEINNANNLNQDEKDELTKQVDQIADNAINAINGAKDDQTAKNAENKGIQDILDVKVPSLDEVKTNAKQAIADALESKTNEINAASNLDSATKQELINRANAEADTAIEKIDQATSNDQALAASQAGVDKILGIEVPTLADAKQSAIDAINDALKQKETEINNASQLTSDEKQNLINQVNSIADNAKNAINNATTNQSVEETKNAGIEKINAINVPTTSATKDEAIKAIDDALTNKVNEINNATNITADEKANLIDEANNAANTAKDNITKATSDSEVATATTDGINAIANVTVPSLETAKDQAKNLIDDVLNEKKNEINNADNLSDSQKQDLINQATDEADQAKKNIDNATTNNDVQTAEDNGAQAIENVTVPSLDEAKKASTKVIDEVLKEKTAEINAATNLSNTEKDALIKDATTAANTAKDNIAKATTNDAVKDAETDGVKAILDIKVPGREDQQKDAIAALDRALADKVSEIDNANNLSETTKQDLKQQAQAAYTTAVDNVNNAQTSAEINAARDNGVQAILDITVPTLTDAQDASITAVEQVRDAKKTQIEAAKNLTETQKEALKNQVDEIADKAIDNIKNATTDATVKDAETAGINEILNVTIPTLDAAKSDAKQAIADALTAKTAEINAAQNLTDAEKQKLIDQAQTEAAAANKKIDAATTNDAAELAAKNGVQAILDIQVPTVEETRDQAKKNVDNALNSKKEEINNSNLSPAAKEALINEAEQAAENARTAIDNATTASAISEAEAAGIAAIENIKVANAPTESDNSSNHQTNTETPTEGNSTSQDNNNATQAPVQGNNTQADLTGSHGTNLTTGQQTEKAADTNSKETLPQTGNETERGLSIAGLAIASLLGLFGLSGLGKKRD